MHRAMTFVAAAGCLNAAVVVAQHEYLEIDIEEGSRLYRGNCIGCHGPDGNLVEGVNLTDPRYLQGVSDEDLITTILEGVPGTAMPPSDYREREAGYIVAYLRDYSRQGRTVPGGDPAAGRALLDSLDCLDCHRIGRSGSRVGPDLSRIGLLRATEELKEALIDPNATILPQNRYVSLVTADGTTVTGRLLNHDGVTVQLLDREERLRLFEKSELRSFEILAESEMLSYEDQLSDQELEDVLSYLVSLQGGEPR